MPTVLAADPRRTATAISARVRQLLDKPRRTASEDDEMLHAAHASRHYIAQAGTPVDLLRAEWDCVHVYAALGRAEPALYHARRGLALSSGPELEPVDRARAYESIACAHAIAGDTEESRGYEWLARRVGARITDADERDKLLADLATIAMLRRLHAPSRGSGSQPLPAEADRGQRAEA